MSTGRFILQQISGDRTAVFQLRNRLFCIGSDPDSDVVVKGRSVPPVAVKIEPFEGGYRSSGADGTAVTVNGKKVGFARLVPGDTITVGKAQFRFDAAPQTAHGEQQGLTGGLLKLIATIGRERELSPLLKKLLRILRELSGGTDVFLFKLDGDGRPQIFESSVPGETGERFSDTIVQTVLSRKEGICISNALADPSFRNAGSIADLKLQSVLCVPMMTAGRCVGLVYIGSSSPAVSFTPRDLSTVTLYASIAGMLINHVDFIVSQQTTIERLAGTGSADGIIAGCSAMRAVITAVQAIAAADITVLLEGETGTGKNRIAELIHARSTRASGPFVVVNCSALHGELLESELFGHKKGSFTGAFSDHPGLFAAAGGGTILLDEIGELELPLQAKLLRTIETGTIRPIGSAGELPVNVRVLCATNRNLGTMVQEGSFRADLYYRINQFPIPVPPLRQRGEDIELLALLLLDRFKRQYPEKTVAGFTPEALHFIRTHNWPGNIRELSNLVHRAVLLAEGPLVRFEQQREDTSFPADFDSATRQFQKQFLEKAIFAADGNKEVAAQNVGLKRSTFYRYLTQLK